MRIKCLMIVFAFLLVQLNGFGQSNGQGDDGYYYDALVIKDYTTNDVSERVSRTKKPIVRSFYLKADGVSYSLFKDKVAKMTADQLLMTIGSGFSLYIDKLEHQEHKNLKPSVMQVLDEDNEVVETIENLADLKISTLKRKLAKDALLRFSGFIISVNEETLGRIEMDVKIIE